MSEDVNTESDSFLCQPQDVGDLPTLNTYFFLCEIKKDNTYPAYVLGVVGKI